MNAHKRMQLPRAAVFSWLLSLFLAIGTTSVADAQESCTPASPGFRSPVNGFQALVGQVMPSTVQIRTVYQTNFDIEEPVQLQPEHGAAGAGFIFAEDTERGETYIASDYHVTIGSHRMHITLANGKSFEGFEVGHDWWWDIVVIKIKAVGLPKVRFGSSSSLVVGDLLLSIGSPYYLAFTAVHGMVSGLNRWDKHVDSIQTDMPIYSGASGGGVFNMCGEVIGKVESSIEHASGLNFVAPADVFRPALEKLRRGEKVEHAFIGMDTVKGAPREFDGVYTNVITKIMKGYAAWKADLHVGDIVKSIDAEIPDVGDDISRIVARHRPGDVVVLSIDRNGDLLDIRVTLSDVPDVPAEKQSDK